ncbi:MAG: hypothetical protein ABMB14_20595, partial [Myxococcota bacterium]
MVFLFAWAAGTAAAQTPSEPWRTLRTEHFRVHYPAVAAAWSESAAARLEAYHARVVAEVGYTPERVIDVVVVDPYSDANGSAIPLAHAPRIQLYATPPDASSVIGNYRTWDEILLVHEDAHVAHMIRPPRNAVERVLYDLVGFGPIASKGPRWVVEGYATVVEGRLTGFGRPNGDGRALVLRRLAQQGQLPGYGELDASAKWLGGSFAYLVGSAYLEWLEERAGPGSLRNLWARMTAKSTRTFDEAFVGVFGAPPAELYGRFTAELTASAVALEEARPASESVFQTIGWDVGAPAVSPDGAKVAVPRRPKDGLPRIDVWSLAIDEKAVESAADAANEALERDPLDVAAVPPVHPPHEQVAHHVSAAFPAWDVRWMPDGASVLYAAWTRDRRGRVRPDLFRWTLDGGTDRITRGADLRSPDPAPDGTWAVAVRSTWGQTQLVRVDLATGATTELTPLSVAVVDQPRISPDGGRLAWLVNDGAGFGVVVRELATGAEWSTRPGPGGAGAFGLAWGRDGHGLLASLGEDGFAEVHEVWRDGGAGRGRLTTTAGGVLAVDGIDGGEVMFTTFGPSGTDLHRAALAPRPLPPLPADAGAAPARRPALPDAPTLPTPVAVTSEPYGAGPIDVSAFAGAAFGTAARQGQAEVGVRIGDPVGRAEWLLVGGYGSETGGATGGRLAATWNGLPVELGLDGYVGSDEAFGLRRGGVGISASDRLDGPS